MGRFPRSMSEIWSTPIVPAARATRSACVKFCAARMSRSASPAVSVDAISCETDKGIAAPPSGVMPDG
jgi:hypothetical protein